MSKKVFTEKDVIEHLQRGGTVASLPANVLLTPSARDRLAGGIQSAVPVAKAAASVSSAPGQYQEPILPNYKYEWKPGSDPKTPADIQRFFHSPEIEVIKQRMCDIGQRMWKKDYVDGNGGNLVVRVGDNLFLTTQTLISKGFMTPETIGLVDFDGKQLAGKYKRTSECLTHLAIYRNQPKARATCHAHPPHATAFAVANVRPPTCMIPEAEVFLGQIGMAEYQTPGTPANAKAVGDVAKNHHAILMVNHGVITWGDHIEDAYWKMENVDSYCKTIWIASQLGNGFKTITQGQAKELIELRKSLGMFDKREEWKECELCDNSEFRPGVVCGIPASKSEDCGCSEKQDKKAIADDMVRQVTDMILAQLGGKV